MHDYTVNITPNYTIYDYYTMPRIIIEKDAIEDIKNKLDSLIQRGQKIDSTDFKKLLDRGLDF